MHVFSIMASARHKFVVHRLYFEVYISVQNFLKLGEIVAEIWRCKIFQDGVRP